MSTRDELETMIEDCVAREGKLTDWERGFVDKVERELRVYGRLSGPQDEKLEEIWRRVT